MNNNITIAALESKFKGAGERLLQICNGTGDPATAVEIALGIYKQPDLGAIVRTGNSEQGIMTFDKFEPLQGSYQVYYRYTRSTEFWFTTAIDADSYTRTGARYGVPNDSKQSGNFIYPATYTRTETDTCTVEQWLLYQPVTESI